MKKKKLRKKLAHYKRLFELNQRTIKEQFKLIQVLFSKQSELQKNKDTELYYHLKNQISDLRNKLIEQSENEPTNNPIHHENSGQYNKAPF